MKRLILITLMILHSLQASTAGAFLDNPVSAKSHALGGASTALLDVNGPYKNPALTSLFKERKLQVMQGSLFGEVNYFNFAYLDPNFYQSEYGFCFTFLNSSVTGIEETTYNSGTGAGTKTGEVFDYSGSGFIFSLSRQFNEKLYLGTNIKYINEKLFNSSGIGYGIDLGANYLYNDQLLLGASIINLIKPNISWDTGYQNELNTQLLLGGRYSYNKNLDIYLDLDYLEKRDLATHFGIEYYIIDTLAIRAGLNKELMTFGFGWEYQNFNIDYAYLNNDDDQLGSTHYISIALGLPKSEEVAEVEAAEEADQTFREAVTEEQLAQEFAEIEPLELPAEKEEPQETAAIVTPAETVTPDEIVPVIPTTPDAEETIVYLPEEEIIPTFNTYIQMMTVRYINKTLQIKVFVDNYGNQLDTISCSLNLLAEDGSLITGFSEEKATTPPDETAVFYFNFKQDEKLAPGNYYIETFVVTVQADKYQKEKYIRRGN